MVVWLIQVSGLDQKMASLYFAPALRKACRMESTLTSGMPQIAASMARCTRVRPESSSANVVRRDELFPERPMKIREIVEADCISYIAHLAIATHFVQQKSASQ